MNDTRSRGQHMAAVSALIVTRRRAVIPSRMILSPFFPSPSYLIILTALLLLSSAVKTLPQGDDPRSERALPLEERSNDDDDVSHTVTALAGGVAVSGTVKFHKYKYYKFSSLSLGNQDLVIDLLPTTGDADIFVGCSLSATGNDDGSPSKSNDHYYWSSQKYGEDSLVIAGSDSKRCSSDYYIAVYGYAEFSATNYTLTAVRAEGTVTLSAGVPAEATVYKNLGANYRFKMGLESQALKVTVTSMYGDSDIYIKVGKDNDDKQYTASYLEYDFKSTNLGIAPDEAVVPETKNCVDCWVSVQVWGFKTSHFSIVATLDDTVVLLTDGLPQKGSLARGSTQFYSVKPSANGTFAAVLTVFNGEPTVYISLSSQQPAGGTADTYSSDSYSTGEFPVASFPFAVAAGTAVYIGVGSDSTNSSYTVRTSTYGAQPALLRLLDGVPQSDTIPYSLSRYWKFYKVTVKAGHEAIDIRVATLVGNVFLYASKCPYTDDAACQGANAEGLSFLPTEQSYLVKSAQSTTIDRADESDAMYIIGVESPGHFSEFQISVSMDNTVLSLQPGVAVLDHVELNEYDSFSFYLDEEFQVLKLTLLPLSGDVDLYVSTTMQRPRGPANYTWRSVEFGSDILKIDPTTDEAACLHCTYYISVFGFKESTYSLTASLYSSIPTLVDSQPVVDDVSPLSPKYYAFKNVYGGTRDLKISLATLSGNADLYVTLDGSQPSWFHYAYASRNIESDDVVRIYHTDESYTSACSASDHSFCTVKIGVYGLLSSELSSEYMLSVTSTLSAMLLKLGVSQADTVATGGREFYRLSLSKNAYTLNVAVTVMTGHVKVYASCKVESSSDNDAPEASLPSEKSSFWSFNPDTNPTFEISSESMRDHGCLEGRSSVDTTLYLTVAGVSSATYSIISKYSNDSSITELVQGVTYSISIRDKELDYYYLRSNPMNNGFQDVKLSVTALNGDVDLYVSASWEERPYYSKTDRRVVSYMYASSLAGSQQLLTIGHDAMLDACAGRDNCYFVVAVYGAYVPASYCELVYSSRDSTVTLSEGLPFSAYVPAGRLEYFRYSVMKPERDVLISVTSQKGDPDLYVGIGSKHHPARYNYTWMSALFGSETLTLQSSQISKFCVPNPSIAKACPIYIGVYGYQTNSSFSILVTSEDDFQSSTRLLDGQPQSGDVPASEYKYYKFYITADLDNNQIETAIKFTLTPLDSGDSDIYIKFAPMNSSGLDSYEPGRENFDYKSMAWAAVVDEIVVKANMDKFCVNCLVYVAVYGFTKSHYSLTATAKGISVVPIGTAIGGHVESEGFQYYSLRNYNDFAEISITLTMVSGDADVYVSKMDSGSRQYSFPTRTDYVWKSYQWGDDSLQILYDDANYCTDCDYIIGVYGYYNSTYTLLVTDDEATEIRLSANRPQLVKSSAGSMKYFTYAVSNSADDVTISMTLLNTGSADMFVAVYNESSGDSNIQFPEPLNQATFKYTTKNTQGNFIFIPGPHGSETTALISVLAYSDLKFTILVSTAQRPVLLRSGVPQNHFVAQDSMEYFHYYVSADVESLKIAVTARSGDPDLLVAQASSEDLPLCVLNSGWSITCSNYTWISNIFSTDQIIISRDFPCTSVIPTTNVNYDSCDPEQTLDSSSNRPIVIGVYGFKESAFTILAVPAGERIQLLAGRPQLTITSVGFECSHRSSKTGACLPASLSKRVEVSNFVFSVGEPGDVIIGVTLNSNSTSESSYLKNPFVMYISSCIGTKCSVDDMWPNSYSGQADVSFPIVNLNGNSLFIGEGSGAYCQPGGGQSCDYYITISKGLPDPEGDDYGSLLSSSTEMTVVARIPKNVILLPCDTNTNASPDGNALALVDEIAGARQLELCGSAYERKTVQLEQCSGNDDVPSNFSLYACTNKDNCESFFPTRSSWTYYSDSQKSCTRSWSAQARQFAKEKCQSITSSEFNYIMPTITLGETADSNYYLTVNGSGKYNLHLLTTVGGKDSTPLLIPLNANKMASAGRGREVSLGYVRGSSAKITWSQVGVLFPSARTYSYASLMKYSVFIVNSDSLGAGSRGLVLTTPCGLSHALATYPDRVSQRFVSLPAGVDYEATLSNVSVVLKGLPASSRLIVTLLATCDSSCLQQAGKAATGATVSCSSGACRTQYSVFKSIGIHTGSSDETNGGGGSSSNSADTSYVRGLVGFTVFVVIMVAGLSGYFIHMWYVMKRCEAAAEGREYQLTEMVDTSLWSSRGRGAGTVLSTTSNALHSSGSSKFSIEEEEEENVQSTHYGGYSPPLLASRFMGAATGAYMKLSAQSGMRRSLAEEEEGEDDIRNGVAI